jgi:hypothetical protein
VRAKAKYAFIRHALADWREQTRFFVKTWFVPAGTLADVIGVNE